jgi:microfibrillar-associated protein 1
LLYTQTRELARLARDRAEREAAEVQRADIERRRQMTDAEIVAENARLKPKAEKQEMRFMQKYFHRGAFYQDTDVIDEKLLKRNFHEAVGYDREVDMTMLPKVMQVKDFGMAGRTKYTHLVDQDTSQLQSNPWATAENEYGVKKNAFQRK